MREQIVVNGFIHEVPAGTGSELRLIADEIDEAQSHGRLTNTAILELVLEAYELDR